MVMMVVSEKVFSLKLLCGTKSPCQAKSSGKRTCCKQHILARFAYVVCFWDTYLQSSSAAVQVDSHTVTLMSVPLT